MTDTLTNPGDVLEGEGKLLQEGRQVASVDYHLTIPNQTYFLINPTGRIRAEYKYLTSEFLVHRARKFAIKSFFVPACPG